MTADAITQAAARNRAARMAQLKRLAPVRAGAIQKAAAFREAQTGAKTAQETIDLMRTLAHVPGFFPTPRDVVARMIERAAIQPGEVVMEPSAGKGDLIKAALVCGATVRGIERNFALAEHCRKQGFNVECRDFLEVEPAQDYDCILMNPPFEARADEKHIGHAMQFLKPGGRLIAVASSTTGARLADEFDIEPLPAGAFARSDRPTGVRSCLIMFRA